MKIYEVYTYYKDRNYHGDFDTLDSALRYLMEKHNIERIGVNATGYYIITFGGKHFVITGE